MAGYLQLSCSDVVLDPTVVKRLTADAGIDGSRADGNATLLEFLITGDAKQLSADIDTYTGAVKSCATRSTSAETPTTIKQLTLPALGDQQSAEVGTCPGWPADSRSYSGWVHVGTVAVLMEVCEQPAKQGAALLISDDQFVQLLTAAVAKFKS